MDLVKRVMRTEMQFKLVIAKRSTIFGQKNTRNDLQLNWNVVPFFVRMPQTSTDDGWNSGESTCI